MPLRMEDEAHRRVWYFRRPPPLLPAAKECVNQLNTEITLPLPSVLSADHTSSQLKSPKYDAHILL